MTSRLNHTGGHRYVTSEQVNELVRQVAPYYTDEQIAFMLNNKHLRLVAATASRPLELATCDAGWACRANPANLPDSSDPTWMSVNQAAQVLGVSPDTIRRWAREGSLEANQVMALRRPGGSTSRTRSSLVWCRMLHQTGWA